MYQIGEHGADVITVMVHPKHGERTFIYKHDVALALSEGWKVKEEPKKEEPEKTHKTEPMVHHPRQPQHPARK